MKNCSTSPSLPYTKELSTWNSLAHGKYYCFHCKNGPGQWKAIYCVFLFILNKSMPREDNSLMPARFAAHITDNYSVNFVDPITKCHANKLKGRTLWRRKSGKAFELTTCMLTFVKPCSNRVFCNQYIACRIKLFLLPIFTPSSHSIFVVFLSVSLWMSR